jgi:hypothetical protein
MGLFTVFSRPAQEVVAEPPNIKVLPATGYIDAIAASISDVSHLELSPPAEAPRPMQISAPATRGNLGHQGKDAATQGLGASSSTSL